MIPYGRQWIDQSDIDAVIEVLHSDFLTQGEKVTEFQNNLASYVGARYSVVCNSATSALHTACLALGVNENSRVWTSGMSFVASANCAKYCGAEVDFVDVDASTGNMSVDALRIKLSLSEINNCLPDVIIPVHYSGIPCDMAEISSLAKQYDIRIVEDASHALGSEYQQNKTGACQYSDICVFSFHPVKMITTGEGGALTTNDSLLNGRLERIISHGITKDVSEFVGLAAEPWAYEQQSLGYNYRMTDIQAALGSSQLKKLDKWVERRNELMSRYREKTTALPVSWLEVSDDKLASYHLAVIKVTSTVRRNCFDYLKKNGVGCQVHYIPIYTQPFYKYLEVSCPNTDAFYEEIISIPLFPKMTNDEQDTVVNVLEAYFK